MAIMQVHDVTVIRLIERIGEHYRSNISNRFIRTALLQLPIDNQTWDLLESFTEKQPTETVHLDELYKEIIAAAHFVSVVRREQPTIRNRLATFDPASMERVLRDMAVNNLSSNVRVFADMINELYIKLVELDKKKSKGRSPVCSKMPELANIGRLLINS